MPKGFAGRKANQAYTAFHRGKGVWGFGKDADIERTKALHDAEPTKHTQPFTGGKGFGDRDSEQAVF